jgi:hypothetical protein
MPRSCPSDARRRPRRLAYTSGFPYPVKALGGACQAGFKVALNYHSRPASNQICFSLTNTAAGPNDMAPAGFNRC